MADSQKPSSSTKPVASKSQNRRRTRSVDDSDPSTSSAAAVIGSSSTARSPAPDPFSFMNTPQPPPGPYGIFIPGQSSHAVNPPSIQIPGINPFAAFPPPHPPPQFQSHLAMWPFLPQQSASFNPSLPLGPAGFVYPQSQQPVPYPIFGADSSRPVVQHTSPVPSTSHIPSPTTSQGGSAIDPEEVAVLEDKRRRNTAASARFRIKKKQKNLNLERTVSDLSSRAEELEREATDLRRENSWLKEMVIMKGRGMMSETRRTQGKEASSDSEDSYRRKGEDEDSEDSDQSDDSMKERETGKRKGKDKGKGKGRKKEESKGKDKGKGKEGK